MLGGAGGSRNQALLLFALLWLTFQLLLPAGLASQAATGSGHAGHASTAAEAVDPNKASSERNHNIAGCGLIALGLLVLVARSWPRFSWLRLVWPALFIAMGLFLVAWSDPEIWPRGELGMSWLLFHDPSARMHKAWALLLMVLGAVEYLRAQEKLGRFWQAWAFPLLALFGASLLLIHQHKGPVMAQAEAPPQQHAHAGMHMDHGASPAPASSVPAFPAPASSTPASSAPASPANPEHAMSPTAQRIEFQHLWFAVVGAAVALFKFLADGGFWRRPFVPHLWPSLVVVLGVLLVLYRE